MFYLFEDDYKWVILDMNPITSHEFLSFFWYRPNESNAFQGFSLLGAKIRGKGSRQSKLAKEITCIGAVQDSWFKCQNMCIYNYSYTIYIYVYIYIHINSAPCVFTLDHMVTKDGALT